MTLTRAEIEREMLKEAVPRSTYEQNAFTLYVSVTERLLREQRERWGHGPGCGCHHAIPSQRDVDGQCVIVVGGLLCGLRLEQYEHRDPRCAPQEKP